MHTTNHITMKKLTALITMLILPASLLSACDKSGLNTDCPAGWTGPSCSTPVGGGAGAGNGSTQEGGTEEGDTAEIPPFDLPEGWRWRDNDAKAGAALAPSVPDIDIDGPFEMLVFVRRLEGGESEAKAFIQKLHEDYQIEYEKDQMQLQQNPSDPEESGYEGLLAPEYKELTIDGTKVFVTMATDLFGIVSWTSEFAFVKNGGVAVFSYGGRIDENENLLKEIVASYRK